MSQYISTKICPAGELGIHGNLFGGTMLAWLDEAGAAFAAYLCATPDMITLHMKEVLFKLPVKTGDHIRFFGEVIRLGNSSITLAIEAQRYLFTTQELEIVCSTEMTFVRINEDGQAMAIDAGVKEQITAAIAEKGQGE